MMWNKGIVIQGFCVTLPILHLHLESNGVLPYCLRALPTPMTDKMLSLGYSLLKEIWSLLLAPKGSNPSFVWAHEVLCLYGQFAHHLIIPYICNNLNL